jgi:predicted esterase
MPRLAALLAAALTLACTTVPGPGTVRTRSAPPEGDFLSYEPLDLTRVSLEAEPITVEDSIILDVYTWLHARSYSATRVRIPGSDGQPATAHFLLPPGPGPHAAVLVFPILAGSHVVSEALAKALVEHGFAVLHIERRQLDFETAQGPEVPAAAFRDSIRDARRFLDWLVTRPEIDPARIGAGGVSLGGMVAASLMGVDDRLRAGFFAMAGGGLAELLWDSTEKPVRAFRERLRARHDLEDRDAFLAFVRPWTEPVDPLRNAGRLDPARVLVISGRFDRVVPKARTEALWEALGRPRWIRLPVGHYQLFPLFWWSAARAAEHLDLALRSPVPGSQTPVTASSGRVSGESESR